ncbi:MAG: hypothetical protein JEY79_18005 [Pseudodesulfovibrio sp.]|nr:hypothetical protein [Pseudodesulfovibrio sp.]
MTEREPRTYGDWNVKEGQERCIEDVYHKINDFRGTRQQCSRKRGHGPDGLYCKQHAKAKLGMRQTDRFSSCSLDKE